MRKPIKKRKAFQREFAIFQRNFGLIVRKLRLKAKLNRPALAKKAEISVSTLAIIEQGRGNPGITRMVRIAEALNTRLSRMFKMAQDMKGKQ